MSKNIANNYAKALIEKASAEELNEIREVLCGISMAMEDQKVRTVVLSPIASEDDKLKVLFGDKAENVKAYNLVRLLNEKGRLSQIGDVYEALRMAAAKNANKYEGFIYSSETLSASVIENVKTQLNQKLGAEIEYRVEKSEIDGFKIEVPDLGVEVSFSQMRMKQEIIEHILKAI